jgi:hypothetical protein
MRELYRCPDGREALLFIDDDLLVVRVATRDGG